MKHLPAAYVVLSSFVLALLPSAAPAAEPASQKCYLLSYFLRNGEDGLDKALAETPDLIILDVMLDTPSEGFGVARRLHGHPRTWEIPVVLVTSINDTVPFRYEPDGTWLPVDALVEKPVGPERLLAVVEERLGARAAGG